MRIVKIQVKCQSCRHEYYSRAKQESCPKCTYVNTTGWTRQLEKDVLARKSRPVTSRTT